jgi:hypothetical protein
MKVFRLLIFISTVSFFFAMIFKIFLDFQEDIIESIYGLNTTIERFISYNGLEVAGQHDWEDSSDTYITEYESMIIFVYFSFDTLTTVGFGDFHPRSDFERVYIAFGLLFGVAIFSFIMGEFINMISNVDAFGINEQGEDLERFFGVLKKFNGDEEVDL